MRSVSPLHVPGATILLAEDDDDIRALLAAALAHAGYRVLQAVSGIGITAQLRALRRENRAPDLLLTDLRMPGMTGLRAVALMREATWRVPVVLMTAFADDWARQEAARLEIDAFLSKPFNIARLLQVIARVLLEAAHE